MKCPHCTVSIHTTIVSNTVASASDATGQRVMWNVYSTKCPNCKQLVISIGSSPLRNNGKYEVCGHETFRVLVWPQATERPVSQDVPHEIAKDYTEAVRVLPLSPQSSAALTRRILQQVLRDFAETKSKDLYDQIQEVLDLGHLPPSLAEQLDAVRVIGNFAAHPLKSKSTGMILPVEENEATWNLDVLEDVFDHYFVKPALVRVRKDALNQKLAAAGKNPI